MSRKIAEELLPRLWQRYANRGREGCSRLIDEVCEQWDYSRKQAAKFRQMLRLQPERLRLKTSFHNTPRLLYGNFHRLFPAATIWNTGTSFWICVIVKNFFRRSRNAFRVRSMMRVTGD